MFTAGRKEKERPEMKVMQTLLNTAKLCVENDGFSQSIIGFRRKSRPFSVAMKRIEERKLLSASRESGSF